MREEVKNEVIINDNDWFILTYELIKPIICNTKINQYSHSQGNYIMTYISLAGNYRKFFIICVGY